MIKPSYCLLEVCSRSALFFKKKSVLVWLYRKKKKKFNLQFKFWTDYSNLAPRLLLWKAKNRSVSRRSLRFDSRSTGLFVNSSAPQSADESLKLFLQLTHFPFRPGQSLTTHLSTFTHRCTPKHAAIRCANQQQQTTLGHNNNKRSTYNTSNRADPRPLPLSLSLCVFMIVSPPSKKQKVVSNPRSRWRKCPPVFVWARRTTPCQTQRGSAVHACKTLLIKELALGEGCWLLLFSHPLIS